MIVGIFFAWLILTSYTDAKFDKLYPGIAGDGLNNCLSASNYTRQNMILRANCRGVFRCVLNVIDNSQQTILSAGSAILGFVGPLAMPSG